MKECQFQDTFYFDFVCLAMVRKSRSYIWKYKILHRDT